MKAKGGYAGQLVDIFANEIDQMLQRRAVATFRDLSDRLKEFIKTKKYKNTWVIITYNSKFQDFNEESSSFAYFQVNQVSIAILNLIE